MRFRAIASALPSHSVTNEEIIARVLKASEETLSAADLARLEARMKRLFRITNSTMRYHRAPGETALALGVRSGKEALAKAGLPPTAIDLLIYVGVARGFLEPATATVFQHELGLVQASAFDILDACASWVRAVDVADAFLQTGKYENILILNAECNAHEYGNCRLSSLEELGFRFPSFTIGEAATATIVSRSSANGSFYSSFRTWGQEHNFCKIPLSHYREYSNGELLPSLEPLEFFSFGDRLFQSVFTKLTDHYRQDKIVSAFKPDIVFGHSASDSLSRRIGTCLGLSHVYLTHADFGNTVSASIPLGIETARRRGHLQSPMNILLGCGSAGTTTAWACVRYEE